MPGIRIRSRGSLPHWEAEGAVYFVTFRLADSLPRGTLLRLRSQEPNETTAPKNKSVASKEYEEFLDGGHGACHLRDPRIAQIVSEALTKFSEQRYRLLAWCLMPNHVHVVFQPASNFSLADIVHSWKSYTGLAVNRLLKRKEPFWQREYYDHLIRNGEQLKRAVRYTAENPQRAGLRDWPWVYVAADAFTGVPESD